MSQNTPQDPSLGSVRPSLTDLAIRFGTDKWGGDGNFQHWYTPHYERHLGHLRDEEFMLLEIGIGGYRDPNTGGASLRMWKHFFPRAQIVGIDIAEKEFVREDRIHPYQGSQDDRAVFERILSDFGPPKVIIDDGSHHPRHVRASFEIGFPMLQADGIYAIEDLQTSYWPEYGGSTDLNDPSTSMGLIKDLLDGLNWEEWKGDEPPTYTQAHVTAVHAYHNLVLLEKGENRESGNTTPVAD